MITTRQKRLVMLAAICLVAGTALFPTAAHAADSLISIGSFLLSGVLQLVLGMLELVHTLIVTLLAKIGDMIQPAANLLPSSGGQTVYTIWRVLRDFCNMAFIIALILMAFGTIFDSLDLPFLKAYSINSREVIVGFLMAAILLNFSLAIGQVVIEASNEVTNIVLKLMPENIGASLAGSLNVASTNVNSFATQPQKSLVVINNVPIEGLTPSQQRAVEEFSTPAASIAYTNCIRDKLGTPSECYTRFILPGILNRSASSAGFRGFINRMNSAELGHLPSATTVLGCIITDCKLRGSAALGDVSNATLFRLITEKIYLIFLTSVLVISFLVVLVFMLVRIPALWILLSLSPLAWTSLAFPGLRAQGYDVWWKQFWAWNLFSPAYLFMLYFGILFINNIGGAVGSLAAQDGSAPTIMGFIGTAFGYFMAGVVLIGGTGLVVKASFMGGTLAGQFTGSFTKFIGTGGTAGAAAPVGRFLGRVTGTTAAYKGARAGIDAQIERRLTKPQKEIEERYKARFSGGGAVEALERNRIRDQMKKNEDEGLSVVDMKDKLGKAKPGSTEYFALSQSLLKEGALSGTQMKELGENANKLGGVGANAIRQQIARKIGEQAKEKKFRDFTKPDGSEVKAKDTALESFGALSRTDGGSEREKFLKDLKTNQPSVYAELVGNADVQAVMASKYLDLDKDGKPKKRMDILNENASKLSDEELLNVYKQSTEKDGTPLEDDDNVKYVLDKKLASKDGDKLLIMADKEMRERLRQETLGATTAAETEVSLVDREKAARASGKNAQEEFKKAKTEYDRDATNVEAKRAMTGALEKAKQAKAEFDEVRTRRANVRPAPGPAPRPPGNTTS